MMCHLFRYVTIGARELRSIILLLQRQISFYTAYRFVLFTRCLLYNTFLCGSFDFVNDTTEMVSSYCSSVLFSYQTFWTVNIDWLQLVNLSFYMLIQHECEWFHPDACFPWMMVAIFVYPSLMISSSFIVVLVCRNLMWKKSPVLGRSRHGNNKLKIGAWGLIERLAYCC